MPGPYGSPAPLKYEIAHGGADPDRVFAIEKKVDTMTAILRDLLAEQTAIQMALISSTSG